jgi:hypothetical protein
LVRGKRPFGLVVCLLAVVAFSPRSVLAAELRFIHADPARVAGYRAYYGGESGVYRQSLNLGRVSGAPGTVLRIVFPVSLLAGMPVYVALTAIDSAGRESDLSNEIVLLPPGTRGPDDSVADDGDGSGLPSDDPCASGQVQGCDDNCPFVPNGPGFGSCTAGEVTRRGEPCLAHADCGPNGGFCSLRQEDSDRDGTGDACDYCVGDPDCFVATCPVSTADSDGDGVGDTCDACPTRSDPRQLDSDRDGRGDVCDVCPARSDPSQPDSDRDGRGDACDVCPTRSDPNQLDSDRDGRGDACDVCPTRSDPNQLDADRDGVGDACDVCPTRSDPDQRDSDRDGVGDACDSTPGGNPPPSPPPNPPPPSPGSSTYQQLREQRERERVARIQAARDSADALRAKLLRQACERFGRCN